MRDYALLLFVLGLVPFILWRAWIGALAWTWIGLMNPHLYTWQFSSFPFAQVIGLAFAAGWVIARDKRMVPTTPEMIGLGLLFAFVSVKTPFSWNHDVAWYLYSQFAKIVIAAVLISTIIYGEKRVRALLWTVILSLGVAYGVKGGIFAIGSRGQLSVQGPEPSFIGGNTHLGVALIMVAPLFVAFMRDTTSVWLRRGAFVAFWLTLLACLFTYSRGTWLGLGAIGPLMWLQTKRKLLVLAALIPVGIVGIGFVPERVFDRFDTIQEYEEDLSALQRLQGWGVAFNVATRHPLGSGFTLDATPVDRWMEYANFVRPEFNRANAAHSIYFQWMGDHGFLGLGLFLFVVGATLLTLWRVRQRVRGDPARAWLGHYAVALQIGIAGYLVAGAFVSLAYFDLFYTYVILAGILRREAYAPTAQAAAAVATAPQPAVTSHAADRVA
jgi:probable O-glycosylation ligase (exosortase A-associated)